MERIIEDISFNADEFAGQSITVDTTLIDEKLEKLVDDEDTTRYIL